MRTKTHAITNFAFVLFADRNIATMEKFKGVNTYTQDTKDLSQLPKHVMWNMAHTVKM